MNARDLESVVLRELSTGARTWQQLVTAYCHACNQQHQSFRESTEDRMGLLMGELEAAGTVARRYVGETRVYSLGKYARERP